MKSATSHTFTQSVAWGRPMLTRLAAWRRAVPVATFLTLAAIAVCETVIPIVVTAADGATTRTYTAAVTRAPAEVALLPAASSALHGFVRVINESDEAGTVTVRAFDDEGEEYGPLTLALEARAAVQLSAQDLESGNPDKGLTGATGPGQGRWRLMFESELAFRALGYVRTREAQGFPNAVHDVVAQSRPSAQDYRYEVVFFNPASNTRQASALRVVNRSEAQAAVSVTGIDDTGEAGKEAVTLTLPAGAARRLSAPELESGDGVGLDGALGDGTGKWRLSIASDRPLSVMSLMGSLDGHLTNLSTAPDGVERLWLLPSAANTVRYGFVRIVNESDAAGEARIRAFDDTGKEYGALTLALEAGAAVQLSSRDLESGNPDKGLTGATGPGQGRWRLAFESELNLRVLGYVRNRGAQGFPNAVHDVVAESRPSAQDYRYEVAFFNPASNTRQASVLRLVNRSEAQAAVTITGLDDTGEAGEGAVTLTLSAGASRRLRAPALESGEGEGLDGALGDGTGKWRLTVASDRPLSVMSLMRSLDGHLTNLSTAPPASRRAEQGDPFAHWNDLEPRDWWRESAPYSCRTEENQTSPWLEAGLGDLGGSDPLSLIRYFGNGSYLRYGHMGFHGCTALTKYPDSYYLDPPADPAYYSLGDLVIHVDVARVPADASGWHLDDGARVDMSMADAVELLNNHVAAYFRRISGDRLRIAFRAGNEFDVPGNGSPDAARDERNRLVGACLKGCEHGAPGGLNRILLSDVATDTGGSAYNGSANFGLATLRDNNMETVVHEMGHGWMSWPHSFAELPWRGSAGEELEPPNPYTNFYDVMSGLDLTPILGWDAEMPSTLAVNRYAAGWIDPADVALHLDDSATYTLRKPFEKGHQFLVVHSGRRFAFTTLEVLEERADRFKVSRAEVHDPAAPGGQRARRYDGVLVSRYDQSAGTGTEVRFGPALHDADNPEFLIDVGWGRDDHALIPHGSSREIGGGVSVAVARNGDGSYEVTVSGGRVAEFKRWCSKIWFSEDEYDTGCFLDEAEWE